jgi:methyl-accepting chemotaxis protein
MVCQFIFSSIIDSKKSTLLDNVHNVQSTSVQLSNMSVEGQKMRRYEKEYFIYLNNDEKRTKYFNQWNEAGQNIAVSLAVIQENPEMEWSENDKTESKEWLKALNKYTEVMSLVNLRVLNGQITTTLDANSAIKDGKNAFRTYLGGTAKSFNAKLVESNELLVEYHELDDKSHLISIALLLLGVVVAVIFVLIISASIQRQIKVLTKSLDTMASGDFNKAIIKPRSPELREIATGIEMLRKSTHILLGTTNKTVTELKALKEKRASDERNEK